MMNNNGPMSELSAEQFVREWNNVTLGERQIAQRHFFDVCRLIGHELPPPDGNGPGGKRFVFEEGVKKDSGGQGYADVWYEDHFAIEYKGKGKDLVAAYLQLLQYRENLHNPPLLVVCDIENWEIHTNFPNTEKRVYRFTNEDILKPEVQERIRWLFETPNRFHPGRDTAEVTREVANSFQSIVDNMRAWKADPDRIAHFMTKLIFCLFAEDVGLLPEGLSEKGGIFTEIVEATRDDPELFGKYIGLLFQAMANGGDVHVRRILYFNGSLFEDVSVEPLPQTSHSQLEQACHLNWTAVEPSIFGTLFERSLDPSKRAQLGAHYTSPDDILLIVEPVLMQPLQREWEAV